MTSDAARRVLLDLLAEEGASRCCYLPGSGNPDLWPTSTCDCKSVPFFFGAAEQLITSEQTGCVEIRHAYRMIAGG